MPRRSSADLAIVPNARPYPAAPTGLQPAAAAVWDAVVRTKPVEWFDAGNAPLLESYCALVIERRAVAAALEGIDRTTLGTDGATLARYERLHRMASGQAKLLKVLATAIRLTQQSKYSHRNAGAEVRNKPAPVGKQPWEA